MMVYSKSYIIKAIALLIYMSIYKHIKYFLYLILIVGPPQSRSSAQILYF